jgi:hypothetical protein
MEKTVEERLTMVENALAQYFAFGWTNFGDLPLAVQELVEYVELRNAPDE